MYSLRHYLKRTVKHCFTANLRIVKSGVLRWCKVVLLTGCGWDLLLGWCMMIFGVPKGAWIVLVSDMRKNRIQTLGNILPYKEWFAFCLCRLKTSWSLEMISESSCKNTAPGNRVAVRLEQIILPIARMQASIGTAVNQRFLMASLGTTHWNT